MNFVRLVVLAQILPAGTAVVVMLGLSGQKEIECAVAIDVDADTFFLGVLMVLLLRFCDGVIFEVFVVMLVKKSTQGSASPVAMVRF